jgi:hypothetical protein
MLNIRLHNSAALLCAALLLAASLMVGFTNTRLSAAALANTADDFEDPSEQAPANQSPSEDINDIPVEELLSLLHRSVDIIVLSKGSENPPSSCSLSGRLWCRDLFRPPCA